MSRPQFSEWRLVSVTLAPRLTSRTLQGSLGVRGAQPPDCSQLGSPPLLCSVSWSLRFPTPRLLVSDPGHECGRGWGTSQGTSVPPPPRQPPSPSLWDASSHGGHGLPGLSPGPLGCLRGGRGVACLALPAGLFRSSVGGRSHVKFPV